MQFRVHDPEANRKVMRGAEITVELADFVPRNAINAIRTVSRGLYERQNTSNRPAAVADPHQSMRLNDQPTSRTHMAYDDANKAQPASRSIMI